MRFALGLLTVVVWLWIMFGLRSTVIGLFQRRAAPWTDAHYAARMAWVFLGLVNLYRIGLWDVLVPFLSWIGRWPPIPNRTFASMSNIVMITITLVAGLYALRFIWLTLPPMARYRHSVISAPLFPTRADIEDMEDRL